MGFKRKDYSHPPEHEIYNPIIRFLRKKMVELEVSVETVAHSADLDPHTVRRLFSGEMVGKYSTVSKLSAAFGYEVALKKVSEPAWTLRAGRRTFGEWGRANTP